MKKILIIISLILNLYSCNKDQKENLVDLNPGQNKTTDESTKSDPIWDAKEHKLLDGGFKLVGFKCNENEELRDVSKTKYFDFSNTVLLVKGDKLTFNWDINHDKNKPLPCVIPPFWCNYAVSGVLDLGVTNWNSETNFTTKFQADQPLKLEPDTINCKSLIEASGGMDHKLFIIDMITSNYIDDNEDETVVIAENSKIGFDEENKYLNIQFEYDFFHYRSSFCNINGMAKRDYPNPIYYFKKFK